MSQGQLVCTLSGETHVVEAATLACRDLLVGAVVNAQQALVNYSLEPNDVSIATNGVVSLQVSTANGVIKRGDPLSPSPISGVAMKATTMGKIIGRAQDDFDDNTKGDHKQIEIKDEKGQNKIVNVGFANTLIAVEDWSPSGDSGNVIVNSIRNFISNAVGHPVTNAQAMMIVAITALALVAAGVIIYSAVSSSIHSIGRNPLSRRVVYSSLFTMMVIATSVVIGAAVVVSVIIRGWK